MQLLYCFLFVLFSYINAIAATEYVYPITSFDNGTLILYIHQISPQDIQLYEWNTKTNHTEQMLWSVFNPAAIELLPNNTGFSFIDNGRLRIKHFNKRAPKSIDFDEPISNIHSLCWLDEHTCYCSAQQNKHFSLFQLDDEGRVCCLMSDQNKDYMYPQKIKEQLFYIQRSQNNHFELNYSIMQTSYNSNSTPKLLIDFYDKPIIFLNMISEKEGFVIEHEKDTKNNDFASFFYHHVIKKGNTWESNLLFSFNIPTNLFAYNNEHRLFESILPLLPKITQNKIYFTDCSDDNYNLKPYYYDLVTETINKIFIKKPQGHLFVPIVCGSKIYCGGTKKNNNKYPLFSVF